MAPRSQPHRVTWPLTAEQADNIDQMFQMLFDDVRNGSIKIALDEITKVKVSPATLFHVGDLIYADTPSHLTTLPDTNDLVVLISGGAETAPLWGKVNLTYHVTDILPVANGGTGLAVYAVGDVLYASGTTTIASLADVATGNAVLSGGVGAAPSYGKIALTTHVSGVLPIANGGTNASSQTTNGVTYFDGTRITSGAVITFASSVLNLHGASAAIKIDGGSNPYLQLSDSTHDYYVQINAGNLEFYTSTGAFVITPNGGEVARFPGGGGLLHIGTSSQTGVIELQGKTSGAVDLKVADVAGSWNWTIPTTAGTTKWFLQTDGAGVTTWENALRIVSNVLTSDVTLNNGAAAATGTLTNAPAAGNPTKWIPVNDNGTTRYIPAW